MEQEFPILDLGFLLGANKSRDYQEGSKKCFVSLCNFLNEHDLCKQALVIKGEEPEPTAKIMASELTEEGMAVMRMSLGKWLRSQDRGKSPADVSILVKGLEKVREIG